MKYLTTTLLVTALTGASMAIAIPVMAAEHGKQGMHRMHDKGCGMHRGSSWKSTLTAQQMKQVSKLKLSYKKKVYPIKTKIKQAKVELALLMTADKPSQKNIDKKIDEILKLKGKKMHQKAKHKIEVRKVLNEDQRVQFDMKILKKAYHGKKGYRRDHR